MLCPGFLRASHGLIRLSSVYSVSGLSVTVIRLHGMHEMLTILADVRRICLSVCLSPGLNRCWRVQCTPRAVCAGSFGAAFVKLLRPLVCVFVYTCM